jgi:ribonuclease HII
MSQPTPPATLQQTASDDPLGFEIAARASGHRYIAGIDEAGRGPLAGPVTAAAVILPELFDLPGLTDSKKLKEHQRDALYPLILAQAVAVAWVAIDAQVIDTINILQATRRAMKQAVEQLSTTPDMILVDGNQKIDWPGDQLTIVKGDSRSLSIAAASIIAKVSRDRLMKQYAIEYPGYGFERHKGYGGKPHKEAIQQLGPCKIHRKTFRGVKEYLQPEVSTVAQVKIVAPEPIRQLSLLTR